MFVQIYKTGITYGVLFKYVSMNTLQVCGDNIEL